MCKYRSNDLKRRLSSSRNRQVSHFLIPI